MKLFKTINVILTISLFVAFSCHFKTDKIHLQDDAKDIKTPEILNMPYIGVSFQRGFHNTCVTIYLDNEKFLEETLTTDDQDGIASYIEVSSGAEIISITTNTDSIILKNAGYKLIDVNYWDSVLSCKTYKEIPKDIIYD